MSMRRFENEGGESVVTFLPCITSGAERDADLSRWYHHLLVSGERVFQYGAPCGTCGITFQRLRSVADRLDDGQVADLLGELEAVPEPEVLHALARVLEPASYFALVLEAAVKRTAPGDEDDYFSSDGVRLFGLEPPEYKRPFDPGTPYFRFGSTHTLSRTGRLGGSHTALVATLLMPLQDLDDLSRKRVDHWKARARGGDPLTALAVSVLDSQAPAMYPADRDYPHEEHIVLTNCLLDGHHRVQAASELGVPIRVLTFLALEASLLPEVDVPTVVDPYLRAVQ